MTTTGYRRSPQFDAGCRQTGRLIFETWNPADRAWGRWNHAASRRCLDIAVIGLVESWVELVALALPFVSFRWHYVFPETDETITSESALRFRSIDQVTHSLVETGFDVVALREAPDRPGREFVFVAAAT